MAQFLSKWIMINILITALLITWIGCLWVLRVAIDWWLDVDYVAKIKKWIKEKKE